MMGNTFEPGDLVRHPEQAQWGLGQVQSVIDGKITVNFEHAGKRVIHVDHINLWSAPMTLDALGE
jgi:uncharacterized protein DUF3553